MIIEKRIEKLNKVRKDGYIPGVLFGKEFGTNSISIMAKPEEFKEAYSKYGKAKTFKIKFEGKSHDVYFKEVEKNPLKQSEVLHFNLLKVSKGDKVTAELKIRVLGEDMIEKSGMIVTQSLHEIEVEYPVGTEISHLEVDATGLEAGDSLHISDIKLPEGFKVFLHAEDVVATVNYPKVHEEPKAEENATVETESKPEAKTE